MSSLPKILRRSARIKRRAVSDLVIVSIPFQKCGRGNVPRPCGYFNRRHILATTHWHLDAPVGSKRKVRTVHHPEGILQNRRANTIRI